MLGLLLIASANAEDAFDAAVSNFEVPTLEASQLSVQGNDLLAIGGAGDTMTDASVHVGSTYTRLSQTPMMEPRKMPPVMPEVSEPMAKP